MNNLNKIKEKLKEEIEDIKNKILMCLEPSKKTVAFVSYLLNCRNQVGSLHKKFKEAGFNVINIVNKRINDRFEKQAPTFLIPKQIETELGVIATEVDFDFIDIIISPDHEHITLPPYNEKFLSERAKRVYLTHDVLNGNAFDCFDYVLMPSKSGIDNHLDKKYRKNFCLIPGGYPKLDYSLERYDKYRKKNYHEENALFYAPTLRGQPVFRENEASFLVGFDANIIETLLENFDNDIIFRPHPHDFNNEFYTIMILKRKFENNKKIIFNYEQKYLDKYLKSKLMITDISDTAFTYSFTTLKPTISFIPFNYPKKSSIGGFNREYRDYIGYTVKNLSELIKSTEKLLREEIDFKEKVESIRDKLVFNIGKSGDYLIENIDYILENKRHPEWIYF